MQGNLCKTVILDESIWTLGEDNNYQLQLKWFQWGGGGGGGLPSGTIVEW